MRADRLLSLLLLLQTKGRMPARELATLLEVSERTIYRDLDALSAAGVPVYADRGRGGGCVLADTFRTNLTGLTETEIRSLFISGTLGPLTELGLAKALEAALLKFVSTLSLANRRGVERVRQKLYLDTAGWFQSPEAVPYLPAIRASVWQEHKIHLNYRKADGTLVDRLVDPYGLVAKASIWYLVGAVAGEVRVFRVARVQAFAPTDEPSERPQAFDLAAYWRACAAWFETSRPYYPVTFRIAPSHLPVLAQMIGEDAHALTIRTGSPDAGGWLSLPVTFGSREQALAVTFGMGTGVEVMEPQELRDSLLQGALEIVASSAQRRGGPPPLQERVAL